MAAPGEVVTVLATMVLPEGTIPTLSLDWTLPPALAFHSIAPVTTGALLASGLVSPSIVDRIAVFGTAVNPGDNAAANDAVVYAVSFRVLPGASGPTPLTLTAR